MGGGASHQHVCSPNQPVSSTQLREKSPVLRCQCISTDLCLCAQLAHMGCGWPGSLQRCSCLLPIPQPDYTHRCNLTLSIVVLHLVLPACLQAAWAFAAPRCCCMPQALPHCHRHPALIPSAPCCPNPPAPPLDWQSTACCDAQRMLICPEAAAAEPQGQVLLTVCAAACCAARCRAAASLWRRSAARTRRVASRGMPTGLVH